MTSDFNKPNKRTMAIANEIANLLENGIHLSADTVHYLESTYGISRPEEIFKALTLPFDTEMESLCEMIFFPDEAQQIILEPVIEESRLETCEDASSLAAILAQRAIETVLYFPKGELLADVPIPEPALYQFINRLRIYRRIDPRITEKVNECISSSNTATAIKVVLRNTMFDFEEHRVSAICSFLTQVEQNNRDYLNLFVFFCNLLDTMNPDENLHLALVKAKRRYVEMIRQSEKTEKDLKKQAMEVMIMNRTPVAAVNIEEVYKNISYIDRIAMSLFGKVETTTLEHAQQAPEVQFGVFKKDNQGIAKVIKILS